MTTTAPPAESKQTPLEFIASQIAAVPNFPKEGILFRDISPLLRNVKARELMFDLIAENYKTKKIDAVAGLDARGFIFATALATRLQCKLVMIRKKSKLPNTISVDYGLEYGTNTIEIQKDAFEPNDNVLIIDDLLATGGTLLAAIKLVEQVKAKVASLCCLIELEGLGGREAIAKVGNYDTFCLLTLPGKAAPEPKAVVPAAAAAVPKPLVPKEFFTLHVKPNDERIVLFYYPPMKAIAESICQKYGDQFRIGNIQWQNFPDGWYNIRFEHMEHLKNRNVVFLGSLRDPTKYLEQISMAMVLPRQLVKSLDLVFPFFGPATMERAEEEGILATAETTAKITTRCMPNTRAGPAVFRVFDIHALPVRFYFEDTVVMNMMSAIPLLTDFIQQTRKSTNSSIAPITCIAYPDEGAAKRFKLMFKTVPAITCSKVRDGDKRSVKIIDRLNWPVDDSHAMDHVLIIDDMVQSGGTLDECRKALVGLGAKNVSCYVTHAVFPNEGWKKFMKGGEREGFYRFFTTNTIPETASQLEGKEPFHIFHIEELLAQSLLTDIGRTKTTPANNSVIRAYVASTAYSKLISAKKAFETAFPEHLVKVYSVEAPSGIPSQPIGFEQTKLGAQNRLEAIRKSVTAETCSWGETDSVFFVSLENGLIKSETAEKTETWKDFCQVLVELHQGSALGKQAAKTVVAAESDMIELPSPVVMKEVFESNCNVTAGSLLEMKHGWEKDTWHKHVSGVDRSEYMAQAISSALKMVQKQ